MRIHDFHGGIHPPENKQQSLRDPVHEAGIPPELVLPLSQHIGAPALPCVSAGDPVLGGEPLALAAGPVSLPLHAPTSGVVAAIEERVIAHPSGHRAPCIVIHTDGRDTWAPLQGTADIAGLDRDGLLRRIADAGIAGMGGAGFPAAVKLSAGGGHGIQTLIINGSECEPYITADDAAMRQYPDRIRSGIEVLRHLVNPRRVLVGIEDNKPESISALRKACRGSDIEVVVFPTKYPSGGEKQLIEILTGRQVPSGALPADVGVICQNIGTVMAVHDAVVEGRPLVSRITTVTGDAVARPGNHHVLLGTSVDYLLALAGFDAARCNHLVMGGPMMGFSLPDPGVPVVKTSNCILAPTAAELPAPPAAQPCIRCGLCAEACPASLLPQQLYWFARGREYDKLDRHNLFDCIECGACSWVCPSHIPLVQYYRASKAEIRQMEQDQRKSEHSRARFEARQERLAREAGERERKRAQRKKAAQQKAAAGDAEDPVQAAIARARAKKAANAGPAQQAEKAGQDTGASGDR